MSGRRRSASDLPRAPLELLHPMAVQGGAVLGAEIASEDTAPHTATLFRLHRALLAWTRDPGQPPGLVDDALRAIELEMLGRLQADPVAAPLAVLTAALLGDSGSELARTAWASLCVSDWAIGGDAKATAVGYAELAAVIWPRHARYAWSVGVLLCRFGRAREAEPWFRRAHRVAVWTDDWEAQARALNSLGLVHFERGRFPRAKRLHLRAMELAHRRGLREIEGIASHNLFAVHSQSGDAEQAEVYAIRTFELYGSGHPRLPDLVCDITTHWNVQGHYQRSLPLFLALESKFTDARTQVHIAAGIARASGSVGEQGLFLTNWEKIRAYSEKDNDPFVTATVLYEAGLGAAGLPDVELATCILTRAHELAARAGVAEICAKAELALTRLACAESPDPAPMRGCGSGCRQAADQLANELAESLRSELVPASSSCPRFP